MDSTLAEWLTAIHFRTSGHVRLIHPLLLLGPPPAPAAGSKQPQLTPQLGASNPQYTQALAALPDAVPMTTVRSVSAALHACSDEPLSAEEAAMSVRDIVCCAVGVLSGTVFVVDCAFDNLGLYVCNRYAPPVLRVAEEARAHAAQSRAAGP